MKILPPIAPRSRVICDNDYGGDPDGLVQLAHHLLSPSIELRGVIGSQVPTYDPSSSLSSSSDAAEAARRVAALAGRHDVVVVGGAGVALTSKSEGNDSDAVDLIVREALRDDTSLPLYLACGGGLTNVGSAWLADRRIGEKLRVVWIGGPEYPDLAEPLEAPLPVEYNLSIDLLAAQVLFNDSDIDIWQIPRNVYRQTLASRSELLMRMRPCGDLGNHIFSALEEGRESFAAFGVHIGETYILGDSPLVLLTALLSSFEPAPSSSQWVERPCPSINSDGTYGPSSTDRSIRIFTNVDSRILLEDLYAKLALHAGAG